MLGPDKPVEWLPVPSAIPVLSDPAASDAIRARITSGHPLVGHFGTHGDAIRGLLAASIPSLIDTTDCHVMLIGRRSDEFRRDLLLQHPALYGRVHATGNLNDQNVSLHVAACDLMLQPYLSRVETEGELSAIFIDGELTHGVRKVPVPGDYRVQDDFGAKDFAIAFPDVALAQRAVGAVAVGQSLLYARADFIESDNGLLLTELELVEPSLFFRHSRQAADRLADAVAKLLLSRH
jgi:hypothetical protein